MPSFTELLTASDADLVRIFYKTSTGEETDFIKRINVVAAQLELNHSQLVCALGFNKHIRELTDIQQQLGFRSFKLLTYRMHELFTTDTYIELPIDNILDIYSERLEDKEVLDTLRELLHPRLEHIEADIEKTLDPAHIISYKMEIHSIYTSGIADKQFADDRLNKDIGKYRLMANEANVIIDAGYHPPSNLFFMDSLSPEEKLDLIDAGHINQDMIKNRLQNAKISAEERDVLEEHI
ncbi:MAG TPA: hypothetical protein EYQ42_04220 [Thiotrichaceae bacterium]|jgi:hypothetical protein|nr:hypothetical protein [Thiotrichaceae bacterium]HIM07760.1 hypothetical protein [Gammaproteobacteria bacterium]